MESNDSPEIPDRGETSDIPGLPSGASQLERRVRDTVHTERQDDRFGGRVPSKKGKAKAVILKSILSLTGSQ